MCSVAGGYGGAGRQNDVICKEIGTIHHRAVTHCGSSIGDRGSCPPNSKDDPNRKADSTVVARLVVTSTRACKGKKIRLKLGAISDERIRHY